VILTLLPPPFFLFFSVRISKKFVGSNYNGKQVYARRTGSDRLSNEEVRERRAKLCELERKFLAKIGAKMNSRGGKAAAAAAAAAAPQGMAENSVLNMQMQSVAALAANGAGSNLNLQQSLAAASANGGATNGMNHGSTGGTTSGVSVSNSGIELRNLINQAAQQQQNNANQNNGGNANSNNHFCGMLEQAQQSLSSSFSQNNMQNANSNSASLQNIFQDLLSGGNNNNNGQSTITCKAIMILAATVTVTTMPVSKPFKR